MVVLPTYNSSQFAAARENAREAAAYLFSIAERSLVKLGSCLTEDFSWKEHRTCLKGCLFIAGKYRIIKSWSIFLKPIGLIGWIVQALFVFFHCLLASSNMADHWETTERVMKLAMTGKIIAANMGMYSLVAGSMAGSVSMQCTFQSVVEYTILWKVQHELQEMYGTMILQNMQHC